MTYLDLKEYTWNINLHKDQFEELFENMNEPIVIRNFYKNTNAYKTWNVDTICDKFGSIVLPLSSGYIEDEKMECLSNISQWVNIDKTMIMSEFVDYIKKNDNPIYYLAEVNLSLLEKNELQKNIISDINNPNYKNALNFNLDALYFGKNSTTDLHIHIVGNYILNQVFGKKTVYFCDYFENDHIIKKTTFIDNIFDNDNTIGPGYPIILNEKKESIPFFDINNTCLKNIHKVTLNPGDSVIIPPWWYHAVKGHDINCSITKIYNRKNLNYLIDKPILLLLFIKWKIIYIYEMIMNNIYDIIYSDTSCLYLISLLVLVIFLLKFFTSSKISSG